MQTIKQNITTIGIFAFFFLAGVSFYVNQTSKMCVNSHVVELTETGAEKTQVSCDR